MQSWLRSSSHLHSNQCWLVWVFSSCMETSTMSTYFWVIYLYSFWQNWWLIFLYGWSHGQKEGTARVPQKPTEGPIPHKDSGLQRKTLPGTSNWFHKNKTKTAEAIQANSGLWKWSFKIRNMTELNNADHHKFQPLKYFISWKLMSTSSFTK